MAKAQKRVYGAIDDPLLGAFLDAFCDKVCCHGNLYSWYLISTFSDIQKLLPPQCCITRALGPIGTIIMKSLKLYSIRMLGLQFPQVVNVMSLWTILLLTDYSTTATHQTMVYVAICSAVIGYEVVLGIVRVQDYYRKRYAVLKRSLWE